MSKDACLKIMNNTDLQVKARVKLLDVLKRKRIRALKRTELVLCLIVLISSNSDKDLKQTLTLDSFLLLLGCLTLLVELVFTSRMQETLSKTLEESAL